LLLAVAVVVERLTVLTWAEAAVLGDFLQVMLVLLLALLIM
jgi:hypothetical protein